jgi:hypothetical protein
MNGEIQLSKGWNALEEIFYGVFQTTIFVNSNFIAGQKLVSRNSE